MCTLITSLYHCHCWRTFQTQGITATGTVRANRLLRAPLPPPEEMQKKERGIIEVWSVCLVHWVDNKVVILASNHQTHEPLNTCKRYNGTKKARLDQPYLIRKYNAHMGSVDQLDGFMNSLWPCIFDDSKNSRGREGTIFYSTLPLPADHEHWGIYLQLCIWDDYHVFLIATLVFTRLLFDEIYHLIKLPFEWLIDDPMFVCLLDELILSFCYSDFTLETGGFELTSTITLVLQANRLTKCASHSMYWG